PGGGAHFQDRRRLSGDRAHAIDIRLPHFVQDSQVVLTVEEKTHLEHLVPQAQREYSGLESTGRRVTTATRQPRRMRARSPLVLLPHLLPQQFQVVPGLGIAGCKGQHVEQDLFRPGPVSFLQENVGEYFARRQRLRYLADQALQQGPRRRELFSAQQHLRPQHLRVHHSVAACFELRYDRFDLVPLALVGVQLGQLHPGGQEAWLVL